MGAHISINLEESCSCWLGSHHLSWGWVSYRIPHIQGSPHSQHKCTWLGSLYINVDWRSTHPVLYLCQQQKFGGKEQQLQRHHPWGVSSNLPARSVLHFRNTHPVFRRHQWTYFPCNVFPELSLHLLSPQCCMILSTTVWEEKVFHLF